MAMGTYRLEVEGEDDETIEGGPGKVAKAVEKATGIKMRGRDNIVPKIAKLKEGDTFEVMDGVTVMLVSRPDDDDEDEDDPEVEPAPVVETEPEDDEDPELLEDPKT